MYRQDVYLSKVNKEHNKMNNFLSSLTTFEEYSTTKQFSIIDINGFSRIIENTLAQGLEYKRRKQGND